MNKRNDNALVCSKKKFATMGFSEPNTNWFIVWRTGNHFKFLFVELNHHSKLTMKNVKFISVNIYVTF